MISLFRSLEEADSVRSYQCSLVCYDVPQHAPICINAAAETTSSLLKGIDQNKVKIQIEIPLILSLSSSLSSSESTENKIKINKRKDRRPLIDSLPRKNKYQKSTSSRHIQHQEDLKGR